MKKLVAKKTAPLKGADKSSERTLKRCTWAKSDLAIEYHDSEWGAPNHDDAYLFEMLILEGAQAGLSWETILKKRENYRAAFDHFDAERVSRYSAKKIAKLLEDEGIVRNKLKVNSTVENAKAFLKIQKEYGSFDRYIWQFVNYEPICHRRKAHTEIPATSPESDAMSKSLKKNGFNFVGSTICYAFMQAVGMVNDHLISCHRY